MCPPGHASSRDPFTGRHTGRPLRSRLKPPSTPEERAGTEPRPYRSIVVHSSGPMWASAPTKGGEAPSTARASGAERSVCASGHHKGWVWGAAEIIPEVSGNLGQSLSRGLWPRQLPLHKGAFPCGGRESGRTHRSAPTRSSECPATPGGAGQGPPPTGAPGVPVCGPMYRRHGLRRPNFVPKFGASVIGIGPYERTGNGSPRPPQGRNFPFPVTPGWFPKEGPQPFLWSFQGGAGREIEIPPGIFLGDPPLTGSGPSPAGRTAPAGRGIPPRPEGDAACQASSGSQSLFSLQKPRGID